MDWINIADAQALTGKGLAIRDRHGWRITDAGHLLASEFRDLACAERMAGRRRPPTPPRTRAPRRTMKEL